MNFYKEKKRCLTVILQALESGQWTVKAQAARAMGTVATKLGGTINPQVILFMLKETVRVNSSNSLSQGGNVRFTTVPLNPLSYQK